MYSLHEIDIYQVKSKIWMYHFLLPGILGMMFAMILHGNFAAKNMLGVEVDESMFTEDLALPEGCNQVTSYD